MLIRFFKSNNASALLILPLIATLFWAGIFFTPNPFPATQTMTLLDFTGGKLIHIPWVASIAGFLLVICEAFLFNFIINENEVLSKKNYLPSLFYLVFMSSHKAMLTLHPLLLGNLFLLLAIHRLLSSYRKDKAFSNAFDAGFLISIATLFYFPFIIFLPLLGIGLLTFRPFHMREWIISGVGLIVPYLFIFTYYFWYDTLGHFFKERMVNLFTKESHSFDNTRSFYFLVGFGWFLILISLGKVLLGTDVGSQKSKISGFFFIFCLALSVGFMLLTNQAQTTFFSALAIPASVFCANYFSNLKKAWWAEILFLILLAVVFTILWKA